MEIQLNHRVIFDVSPNLLLAANAFASAVREAIDAAKEAAGNGSPLPTGAAEEEQDCGAFPDEQPAAESEPEQESATEEAAPAEEQETEPAFEKQAEVSSDAATTRPTRKELMRDLLQWLSTHRTDGATLRAKEIAIEKFGTSSVSGLSAAQLEEFLDELRAAIGE